jgi:hypothetical protein
LLYGLKTLFGIESMTALPPLLFSDEALMQLVSFNAQQVREGCVPGGAAKRQGEPSGPMCPDSLARNIVKWNSRQLEVVFKGAICALARAGVFGVRGTGIVDGTDLETTERYTGGGQVTRTVCIEDKQSRRHAIEVTVHGWKVLLWIDAATKTPLAVKVGKIHEYEAFWTRALVTQAHLNLQGYT